MRTYVIAMAAVCCAVNTVSGQVTPIPQFTGEHSDPFSGTAPGSAVQHLDIFGGRVAVEAPLNGGGSVKVELSSSLGGNLLTPRTGGWMVGVLHGDGDPRPGTFIFDDNNVHRFGGYFGNNSPTDDAWMEFRDSSGNLLGSFILDIPSSGNTWRWHGFESVVPIRTITFKGLSPDPFSGGFIWFDDLELGLGNPPPPQGACCLSDRDCEVMTESSCVDAAGQYGGNGTTCDDLDGDGIPDACEVFQVTGACCFERGLCGVFTADDCALARGTYQGDGATCVDINGNGAPDVCEPPCEGDADGNRTVGITDFLAVLAQWGPCGVCSADVDADTEVGINDFLMVLGNWGACP